MQSLLSVCDETPFITYREFAPVAGINPTHVYANSLISLYESERFRTVDEALRQEILQLPTSRESWKLASKHLHRTRTDWDQVHVRIMSLAMTCKLLSLPAVGRCLQNLDPRQPVAYDLPTHFWTEIPHGQSLNRFTILWHHVWKRFQSTDIPKVAVLGSQRFHNAFLLQSAWSFYIRKTPSLVIVQDSPGTGRLAERWAQSLYIPIVVCGHWHSHSLNKQRRSVESVLQLATQTLLVGENTDRAIEAAIEIFRKTKHPFRFIEVSADGARVRNTKRSGIRR